MQMKFNLAYHITKYQLPVQLEQRICAFVFLGSSSQWYTKCLKISDQRCIMLVQTDSSDSVPLQLLNNVHHTVDPSNLGHSTGSRCTRITDTLLDKVSHSREHAPGKSIFAWRIYLIASQNTYSQCRYPFGNKTSPIPCPFYEVSTKTDR